MISVSQKIYSFVFVAVLSENEDSNNGPLQSETKQEPIISLKIALIKGGRIQLHYCIDPEKRRKDRRYSR